MKPEHILVIRLSAMGDVAMTIPVLQQLLQQNPEVQLTVLTQRFLVPLFEPLERTTVYPVETKGRHKGVKGLWQLCRELKKQYRIDAIADLHNVLRSKIIRFFFRSSRLKAAVIDKGRRQKRKLTRKKNKELTPLKSSFQRYADVFAELGLAISLNKSQPVFPRQPLPEAAMSFIIPGKKYICIAPFARHPEKMYPLEQMKLVIADLIKHENTGIVLIGGGASELALMQELQNEFPQIINLGGKFSFKEELAIISHMDLVLSMDSANMHLASLYGVPVISVWGATHPFAGFYGWGQSPDHAVQIELYCRPCSVFGNKPCYRGDHACMRQLPPEMILQKVSGEINQTS